MEKKKTEKENPKKSKKTKRIQKYTKSGWCCKGNEPVVWRKINKITF